MWSSRARIDGSSTCGGSSKPSLQTACGSLPSTSAGTKTASNSRPFAWWMVMTWTAPATASGSATSSPTPESSTSSRCSRKAPSDWSGRARQNSSTRSAKWATLAAICEPSPGDAYASSPSSRRVLSIIS